GYLECRHNRKPESKPFGSHCGEWSFSGQAEHYKRLLSFRSGFENQRSQRHISKPLPVRIASMATSRNSRGYALITALIVATITAGLVFAFMNQVNTQQKIGYNDGDYANAFYAAEAGLE